jgi:hypothetical protein
MRIPKALSDRLALWQYAVRWGVSTMMFVVWQVLFGLFTFRDNFLPEDWKKTLGTSGLISKLDWQIWIMVSLLIAVIAALEGCYHGYRRKVAELDKGYHKRCDEQNTAHQTREAIVIAELDSVKSQATAVSAQLARMTEQCEQGHRYNLELIKRIDDEGPKIEVGYFFGASED